jgi:hypothetical protein
MVPEFTASLKTIFALKDREHRFRGLSQDPIWIYIAILNPLVRL